MVLYGPLALATKVSLLLVIARVFRPHRKVVIFVYVAMVFLVLYYTPAIIVKFLLCQPIQRFWGGTTEGHCLNQMSVMLSDAVLSSITDIIILILPIPITVNLQMPLRKKVRAIAILGAGGIACIVSIARLVLLVLTHNSPDQTYVVMVITMLG
ncbi:hypothetical protein BJX63DRAFT_441621 [Aspergillus granulosus]|uniref:Rhodopsin domain-containing protein n=1 Tax=Aspergillus granulosus TaxID=176169 RepID=A0ABR4GSB9_9EURO